MFMEPECEGAAWSESWRQVDDWAWRELSGEGESRALEYHSDPLRQKINALRGECYEKRLPVAEEPVTQEFIRSSVEAGIVLGNRQQVNFTFFPQQGVFLSSRKLPLPSVLILHEFRRDVGGPVVAG